MALEDIENRYIKIFEREFSPKRKILLDDKLLSFWAKQNGTTVFDILWNNRLDILILERQKEIYL